LTKQEVVNRILAGRKQKPGKAGRSFAAANIALCKYWGKRDDELNLPLTSSLSVSLRTKGTTTSLSVSERADEVLVSGEPLSPESPVHVRMRGYLDLFRPEPGLGFVVRTESNIPLAAGLASSASVFASVVLALDHLFGWKLQLPELSILARLGSGSACRSIHPGFVEWEAGRAADGMDSHAVPLPEQWPELRLGLLLLTTQAKPIGSRPAMKRTRETSVLYAAWPAQVEGDLRNLKEAIRDHDFERLGRTAEANALAMHATMISSWPPVLYWLPESVEAMRKIWALREGGLALYFTMDAGPNLKLLFQASDEARVAAEFPGLEVVAPFGGGSVKS
jgi:diphosphomevalonate decarboxylase